MRKVALAIALLLPLTARAEMQLDGGQADHGVVVAARLGTQLFSFNTNNNGTATASLSTLQGGIFGGYKIKRIIFGLGFDLARVANGANNNSTATTSVLFSPGLSVAIVRSADRRVELFAQLDMGFGTTVTDPAIPNTSFFHFAYDVGPGLRYWPHPQFAVGALAGLGGQFEFDSTSVPNGPAVKTSTGLTSVFAQLQLTGVF